MKTILLSAFLLLVTSMFAQTYVTIPDANFAKWLRTYIPNAMKVDQLDISHQDVLTRTDIFIDAYGVEDISGIEYFTSLVNLSVANYSEQTTGKRNSIKILTNLPPSLVILDLSSNKLTSLPILPTSLQQLNCQYNQISQLPPFPQTLTTLMANGNQLKEVPTLPDNLQLLDLASNMISTLPNLPNKLTFLNLSYNPIGSLTSVPSTLNVLYVTECGLNILPNLPLSVSFLECGFNQLTALPELPNSLITLNCSDNKITCFPKFPKSLSTINISNNAFSCLPNYLPCMDKVTLSFPLCAEGNISGCPSAEEGIVGFTTKDENADCKKDEKEQGISNLPLMLLDANNNVIAQTITAENGVYQFSTLGASTYQVQLDKDNIPFAVVCNDKQAVDLTNQTYAKDVNFSLTCKDGMDVGVRSIATSGIIFPGQPHTLTVAAGDMSNWYNMHCATGKAGKLQLTISGPVVYKGIKIGSLTPSIAGNVYTYDIADFGDVNFTEDFGLQFETETTAQAGDQICVDAQITPTSGDNNLANNQYSFCYSVVNSHDPNLKEVFPANFKPGYDGYLTYTVHFQNTGSAPAFNIRLLDTLDTKLDLSTFEVLNYSHKNRVELNGNIMQVFYNNIHLKDSTTNEKASHGFIQYRIKPKKAIAESDQIKNTAHIYFDFNEAVVTNTTISKANKSLGLENKKETTLRIYPNPAETMITLERATSSNAKLNVQMLNVNGHVVYATTLENTTNHTIDISAYTPGMYFINVVSDVTSEILKVVKK